MFQDFSLLSLGSGKRFTFPEAQYFVPITSRNNGSKENLIYVFYWDFCHLSAARGNHNCNLKFADFSNFWNYGWIKTDIFCDQSKCLGIFRKHSQNICIFTIFVPDTTKHKSHTFKIGLEHIFLTTFDTNILVIST